ncbi:Uncharacterised protein [Vibrio cholerae]|nr:Uncharacterised protein [Vibrio cholerae]CSI78246.1 Uncharacterised protein [Vibrio cholerae]
MGNQRSFTLVLLIRNAGATSNTHFNRQAGECRQDCCCTAGIANAHLTKHQ